MAASQARSTLGVNRSDSDHIGPCNLFIPVFLTCAAGEPSSKGAERLRLPTNPCNQLSSRVALSLDGELLGAPAAEQAISVATALATASLNLPDEISLDELAHSD